MTAALVAVVGVGGGGVGGGGGGGDGRVVAAVVTAVVAAVADLFEYGQVLVLVHLGLVVAQILRALPPPAERLEHARVLADAACAGAGGVCDADVAARSLEACERAFEKLARAAEFGVGDVDAHVALGEARRTRSDVLRGILGVEARRRMETSYPESLHRLTRSSDDLFADADAALARVSDPDHPHPLGFARALRLDSRHLDALVGAAECHVERGKMRVSFQPSENPSRDGDDSKAHFARGWATYRVALEGPLLFPDDPTFIVSGAGILIFPSCCCGF